MNNFEAAQMEWQVAVSTQPGNPDDPCEPIRIAVEALAGKAQQKQEEANLLVKAHTIGTYELIRCQQEQAGINVPGSESAGG